MHVLAVRGAGAEAPTVEISQGIPGQSRRNFSHNTQLLLERHLPHRENAALHYSLRDRSLLVISVIKLKMDANIDGIVGQ